MASNVTSEWKHNSLTKKQLSMKECNTSAIQLYNVSKNKLVSFHSVEFFFFKCIVVDLYVALRGLAREE